MKIETNYTCPPTTGNCTKKCGNGIFEGIDKSVR